MKLKTSSACARAYIVNHPSVCVHQKILISITFSGLAEIVKRIKPTIVHPEYSLHHLWSLLGHNRWHLGQVLLLTFQAVQA